MQEVINDKFFSSDQGFNVPMKNEDFSLPCG